MAQTTTLTYTVDISANPETVFAYMTNWQAQSDWIALTDVSEEPNVPNQIGKKLYARTHIGPIGFTDTMVIQEWIPGQSCTVQHVGNVVQGVGIFSVSSLGPNKTRFTWEEISPVPFGALGRAGLVLMKPLLQFAFNRSLKKMKANIEAQ